MQLYTIIACESIIAVGTILRETFVNFVVLVLSVKDFSAESMATATHN